MKMKNKILLILFVFSFNFSFSQINKKFGDKSELNKEYFFAIRLMPSLNGGLYQCAILKKGVSAPYDIINLSLNSWIRQAAGYETSKANPTGENLLAKYNVFKVPEKAKKIEDSEVVMYTIKKTEAIFNNLWRVRYSEYPYFSLSKKNEKGWAKHPDPQITWLPSDSQMQILRAFGIDELSDFIIEDKVFLFLKAVRDRNWQNSYIQSARTFSEDSQEDIPDE